MKTCPISCLGSSIVLLWILRRRRDHFGLFVGYLICKCKLRRCLRVNIYFSLTWHGFFNNFIGIHNISHKLSFVINPVLFYPAVPAWSHNFFRVLRPDRIVVCVLNLPPVFVTFVVDLRNGVLRDKSPLNTHMIPPRLVNSQNSWTYVVTAIRRAIERDNP